MWDCQFLYINIYDNINDIIKKNLKKMNDLCVLSRAYIPNALLHINNLSLIRESKFEIFLILKLEYILDLM